MENQLKNAQTTLIAAVRKLQQSAVTSDALMLYEVAMQMIDGYGHQLTAIHDKAMDMLARVRNYDATKADLIELAKEAIDKIYSMTQVSDR